MEIVKVGSVATCDELLIRFRVGQMNLFIIRDPVKPDSFQLSITITFLQIK